MDYQERYTAAELQSIIEQGMIYMCACPAQVAEGVRKLRDMYRYQSKCLEDPQNDNAVHAAIARRVTEAHETLQVCLDEVIALEKWDRATLEMPTYLRQRQMNVVTDD